MRKFKLNFGILMIILIFFSDCSSQNNKQTNNGSNQDANLVNRKPAVAGQFYAADSNELKANLQQYFLLASANSSKNVVAIISPHAGYVFSGEVAASAFNQIDKNKQYENIFVIASSHRMEFNGASIYDQGNFITPLGEVKVNIELAKQLKKDNKVFNFGPESHIAEHSLEVQLPFLQYHLKRPFQIIPILVGTFSDSTCREIARILKPYLNHNNLFVISTDFSHYPKYESAVISDKLTAEAIISNKPAELIRIMGKNEKEIPGCATAICGWSSVLSLMYMTENNPDVTYQLIQYKNSGNSPYGDKNRVVGYNAIAVSMKDKNEFTLTDKDKKDLLEIARKTAETYVRFHKMPEFDPKGYSANLLKPVGAFVTYTIDGKLRGCIGTFSPDKPLYQIVMEMAVSSAVNDYRFRPVTADELPKIEIEISVLTPMKRITSIDEIELGKHGIYIKKGNNSGTFLPQVATDTKWTKEQFLGNCSQEKAGLGWDGWKTAELFTYEAIVFHEKKK